jgi:outer membrane protein assembly factor BamB
LSHLFPNPIATFCKAALAGCAIVCLLAAPAHALVSQVAPWPQFQGGPAHVGSSDGPAPPYGQRWRFPIEQVGDQAASPPVVVDDQAITVGPNAVYAIDLTNGQQAWKLARAPGPTAPPAVTTVKGQPVVLYTEGSTSADSMLRAVIITTRRPAWDPLALGEESRSGVTVDGDTAFVGDDAGTVHAVDVTTGAERWTARLTAGVPGPLTVDGGRVFAVPQAALEFTAPGATPTASPTTSPSTGPSSSAGPIVGAPDRASLVALSETTGKEDWVYPLPVGTAFTSLPLAANGVVYVSVSNTTLNGDLIAVGADDGIERWAHPGVGAVWQTSSPAMGAGGVFVGDGRGGLWKFDPADGSRLFDFQFNEVIRKSSPVVVGGTTVLIGLGDGRVAALDVTTGHERWEAPARPGLVGAIAVTNDLVLAAKGGPRGGIVAFAPDSSRNLIDVTSPSVADTGRLLGNFAIALVVVTAVLAVPFRYASRRMGGVRFPTDVEEEPAAEDAGDDPG